MLADTINEVKTTEDGSVYVNFKNNVILEANGSILLHTPNGASVIQSEFTFINPATKIDISSNIDNTIRSTKVIALAITNNENKICTDSNCTL